jgi:RNA polymerase sigma-70 factor (ECF subfamily)
LSGLDDRDLARSLRAALEGDERAYGDFLRHAANLIRAWARRRTNFSGLDPEDIVQETLLAIHLKRHTWRSDGPVAPWLYAIARHKLIDALRRQGRHPRTEISEVEDRLAAEEAETVREWEIGRALETLPPGQRSVVTAISVEGRTIAEAARSLDMNETAVRVALHRGLAAIARRFGRDRHGD